MPWPKGGRRGREEDRQAYEARVVQDAAPRKQSVRLCQARLAPLGCHAGGALGVVVEAGDDVAVGRVFQVIRLLLVDGILARLLDGVNASAERENTREKTKPARRTSCRSMMRRFWSISFNCCLDFS